MHLRLWSARFAQTHRFRFAARRLCDLAEMGPEDRIQPLNGAVIEYIVHDYFYYREEDQNGAHGAWWVSLRDMVQQLGISWARSTGGEAAEHFEQEMQRLKADAIVRALEEDSSDAGGS